jgi:hypothetical protein
VLNGYNNWFYCLKERNQKPRKTVAEKNNFNGRVTVSVQKISSKMRGYTNVQGIQ